MHAQSINSSQRTINTNTRQQFNWQSLASIICSTNHIISTWSNNNTILCFLSHHQSIRTYPQTLSFNHKNQFLPSTSHLSCNSQLLILCCLIWSQINKPPSASQTHDQFVKLLVAVPRMVVHLKYSLQHFTGHVRPTPIRDIDKGKNQIKTLVESTKARSSYLWGGRWAWRWRCRQAEGVREACNWME